MFYVFSWGQPPKLTGNLALPFEIMPLAGGNNNYATNFLALILDQISITEVIRLTIMATNTTIKH